MVDFINEVEEELRKDDYNRLLKKYGPIIGVILFLIVAGAAFLEWQEYAQDKSAQKVAAVYTAADTALEAGDLNDATEQFIALGETGPEGYAGLSLMRAAAIRHEQGDLASAILYFDQAAAKFSTPRHKQLAQLKSAYLLADQGAYSDVVTRMTPLIEENAPYEFLARELLGFAQQQSGNESAAREQFAYLTAIPGVPQTVKQRAEQSIALMNAESVINAPEPVLNTPTDEPTEPTETDATDED
ncbi:tetratricopeptide repeat protein [Litorimonas sp. WD9-15]|uniref:tetratricopeptide repeat protein n=1 Tax=Litorimonas sp. WD9-15 TaxID=3418716 RepID=UPI003D0775AE